MSTYLSIYKQNKINALIAIFNSTKSSLTSQLANNIKIIQKSRLNNKSKQTQINNYIAKYNYILSALKNELNANILKINNFMPTVVAIDNTKQKRALLIGINYTGTANELQGCINDVLSVNDKLTQNGFKNINIMTDLTPIIPTRNNILSINLVKYKLSGWRQYNSIYYIDENIKYVSEFINKHKLVVLEDYNTSDRNYKNIKLPINEII